MKDEAKVVNQEKRKREYEEREVVRQQRKEKKKEERKRKLEESGGRDEEGARDLVRKGGTSDVAEADRDLPSCLESDLACPREPRRS